jgi:hypothetical protein
MSRILGLFAALAILGSQKAQAVPPTVTLEAVDTGWYSENGGHEPTNPNYITGRAEGTEFRGFFVFDLSTVGSVGHATLRMFNPSSPPLTNNGYQSPDPFEELAIRDVATSIVTLRSGAGGIAAFNDLGSGTTYGSTNASNADNGHFVEVTLNSNALAALSGSNGLFAFGSSLTTLNGHFFEYALGESQSGPVFLDIVPVPEPSTSMMLMFATAGWCLRRGRGM